MERSHFRRLRSAAPTWAPTTIWETARTRGRWYYRTELGQHELPYMLLDRVRAWLDSRFADLVVTRHTDLVVEGFPRSANTFAAVAVRSAQPRQIRVACRRHAVAQVARASRLGIPCVVCIRNPHDALVSAYIQDRGMVDLGYAMRSYIRFYSGIMQFRKSFLLVRFETITSSPNSLIRSINQKFGTEFHQLPEDKTDSIMLNEIVDHFQQRFWKHGVLDPLRVSRPAFERQAFRHQAAEAIHRPNLHVLLQICDRKYHELATQADA